MHTLASYLFLVPLFYAAVARLLHSLPEDTHAFPKFRVEFLNSLPVLNETAAQWLKDGLLGGELEFLDQSRKFFSYPMSPDPKAIESGPSQLQSEAETIDALLASGDFTLELLKLGTRDSYICLIPKPLDNTSSPPLEEQSDTGLAPARGWALLKPLIGTCLYHRHSWFTYSYCHNHEIRQFKELVPQSPQLAGSYVPEEDPEWESYTLGRAPMQPAPGAELTIAEQGAHATNLELAKNAGSRYLVQRWGDGTLCDKTGKNREVEVQFHCSMTMTDQILFVKETKTCSYVLVINTPRLCGEPSFRSRRDATDETKIRCREIVETLPENPFNYPAADYPIKSSSPPPPPPSRQHNLPGPVAAVRSENGRSEDTEYSETDEKQDRIVDDLVAQTIQALMRKTRGGKTDKAGGPTEVIIEFGDDTEDDVEVSNKLTEALRAAGFDILNAEVLGFHASSKEGDKDKEEGNGRNGNGRKKRFERSIDNVDEYARDEL